MVPFHNISPNFRGCTRTERRVAEEILRREKSPKAILFFAKHCDRLGDYAYWFFLSTLWVSYTGHSDLKLWKKLFASKRPGRATSIMKPDEYRQFCALPEVVLGYRAHRPGETDWIAYTLDEQVVGRFAAQRGVKEVSAYKIPKSEILGLFLRRGEAEVLVLDKNKVEAIGRARVL